MIIMIIIIIIIWFNTILPFIHYSIRTCHLIHYQISSWWWWWWGWSHKKIELEIQKKSYLIFSLYMAEFFFLSISFSGVCVCLCVKKRLILSIKYISHFQSSLSTWLFIFQKSIFLMLDKLLFGRLPFQCLFLLWDDHHQPS